MFQQQTVSHYSNHWWEENREERFFELEKLIEKGLKAFYEVGKALTEIRDEKLYKEKGYSNFRKYCDQRWGLKKSHAYRVIKAAAVLDNLMSPMKVSPIGDSSEPEFLPRNESQVRPLTKLEPTLQREAWSQVVETAPQGKITTEHIQKVAKKVYNSQFQESQVENPPSFPESKPGDCVQIHLRNRSDAELNVYNRELAIVEEVKDYSVVVKVWGQLLPPLFLDEIRPAPVRKTVTATVSTELLQRLMEKGYDSIDAALEDCLS